jgi:hypothetical protein
MFYTDPMALPSEVSFADSLKSERRGDFYERHKLVAIVMILIVFLLPFVGLVVTGLFGVVLGVLISIAGYYVTPYVWIKLRP